ncbi:OadG family protein [Saccharicrinis aurantiacus]|uniref:OadG family protein n=1 Tax=Saccharicrinis aurantiacus TaxID=1849719 RepID=UPI000839904E|nr:OadG family protein [Saccharicrinis aurantiacus]
MTLLFVDSSTWTITLLGWAIVFCALLFLVGIFLTVPKILKWVTNRKIKVVENGQEVVKDINDISGETNAVIATALHLFLNEQHDDESNVITIKQVWKRYSPWSSKLYGMTNYGFPHNVSKQNRYARK